MSNSTHESRISTMEAHLKNMGENIIEIKGMVQRGTDQNVQILMDLAVMQSNLRDIKKKQRDDDFRLQTLEDYQNAQKGAMAILSAGVSAVMSAAMAVFIAVLNYFMSKP